MQYFQIMVDTARNVGMLSREMRVYSDGTEEWTGNAGMAPPHSGFWSRIERCQPFVFTSGDSSVHTGTSGTEEDFDPPFPVFSIECLDGPLGIMPSETDGGLGIYCVIVEEVGPKQYKYNSLVKNPSGRWIVTPPDSHISPIVGHYLDRMSKEKTGTQTSRVNIKIGTGKDKRTHRVRKIIHVCPKKLVSSIYQESNNIDWSHRWSVRGHWVKLPGKLGKDREGNYCVKDWTWRVEHTKGPEHLPLINKVRVVE